jgi:hypothetical protein
VPGAQSEHEPAAALDHAPILHCVHVAAEVATGAHEADPIVQDRQ